MSPVADSHRRALLRVERAIPDCQCCPRLLEHCRAVARKKRRAYIDQDYWGRPVPGFGDPGAKVLFLGLAPGAHGANRTGRMFTGDRSGEWLYRALHRAGFASQPTSEHRNDGLTLINSYISAICRCAPPQNKPTLQEQQNCAPFLDREFENLQDLRVVVALGQIAWDGLWKRAKRLALAPLPSPKPKFGHGAVMRVQLQATEAGRPLDVIGSYHPSQQNTLTGRLTQEMLDSVIEQARKVAG